MRERIIHIVALSALALSQAINAPAQPVTGVATGFQHSLFLKADGSLWSMGFNASGQLGDGTFDSTNRPQKIVASNVTAIAAGGYHSLFIKSDGSLWATGADDIGQLGDGTNNNANLPEKIVASNVVAIAAGESHTLFLKSDGSLWAMGANEYGQLGDGTEGSTPYYGTNVPEQIVASNVTAIAAGYWHSLFIKRDGSLWGMGWNGDGELGDGTYNNTPFPEQLVASNVTAVAAGSAQTLFIKSDGSLWATGWNQYGQLGDGTYGGVYPYETNIPEQVVSSNVAAIVAGDWHSLFLKQDGSLWAMGSNDYGQLGDDTNNKTNRPEQIVTDGVTAIAGFDQSLFLRSDGSLWGMGYNYDGELGDGTNTQTNRPELLVAGPAGYNQIVARLLRGSDLQFSFVGIAGANYALDRSYSIAPGNWAPQITNSANASGAVIFTNTADVTRDNFWRVRLAR
ncbi:MAG TPA: chromosome condensation regulator [Verrucomicrobiae bacterium]|jgi:alpha-tubulin suppressor-like RCC1 family protein|nr:chromosome condensation regulator [Verrucomicrobiae bacterium]